MAQLSEEDTFVDLSAMIIDIVDCFRRLASQLKTPDNSIRRPVDDRDSEDVCGSAARHARFSIRPDILVFFFETIWEGRCL